MKRIAAIILGMVCAYGQVVYAEPEQTQKKVAQLTSFADIIEPLMPAVVNIYTAKYNDGGWRSKKGIAFELLPLERINEFCEQFNVPFSFDDLYSKSRATALGAGLIIDKAGLIVTNHHVVANSDEIHIRLSDNSEIPASIIGSDPQTDLALLKIESNEKFPFVTFGNSTKTRVGDIVIAIGNPLGFGGTVTTGIISSKRRDLGTDIDELVDDFIQTDAAINTGNSGGPLFNIKGEVIGVNSAILDVGRGTNMGIGFAIPSNTVKDIIEQLKANGKINRGRLGITIQEITKEIADARGLSRSGGVSVVGVKPGGSGDKAGLLHGDLITHFNGQEILNSRKLQLFVAETHVGESAKLTVLRQGETLELTADIDEIDKSNVSTAEDLKKAGDKVGRGRLGIKIQEVTEELADALGLNQSTGVLVAGVKAGSCGDKAGLQQGDVIVQFNGQEILNSTKLQLYVAEAQIGESAKLSVIRRGEALDLTINIDEIDVNNAGTAVESKTSTVQKSGVTFSNLSPSVIAKFNLGENSKGVVITSIQDKELKSDLRSGDLVLAVDHQDVTDIDQFTALYDNVQNIKKKNVVLLVKRQELTMFVALPVK